MLLLYAALPIRPWSYPIAAASLMHMAVAPLVARMLSFARSVEEHRQALRSEETGCKSAAICLGRHSMRRNLLAMGLTAAVKLNRGMRSIGTSTQLHDMGRWRM